jgi:hypothetical protein
MDKQFFVMMFNQKGNHILPLIDDNENIKLWDDETEALEYAESHFYASKFGFEIFEIGTGL